jgi:hypothetical protein
MLGLEQLELIVGNLDGVQLYSSRDRTQLQQGVNSRGTLQSLIVRKGDRNDDNDNNKTEPQHRERQPLV